MYRSIWLLLLPALGCDDTKLSNGRACLGLAAPDGTCPSPEEVDLYLLSASVCGAQVSSIEGPGRFEKCNWYEVTDTGPVETCVYPVKMAIPEDGCDFGRPLVIDGAGRRAPVIPCADQAAAGTGLDTSRRLAWGAVGQAEHASVGSFMRVVLELMSLGAPAALVAEAQRAAADEVEHAQLAFAFASTSDAPVGPGPLPLAGLLLRTDWVSFAVATAREACVAETLSALQVAAASRLAVGEEREALSRIAADEARHAALGWRTLRWALEQGPPTAREAVARVFAAPPGVGASPLLPDPVAREVATRGWAEVVLPAAELLLRLSAGTGPGVGATSAPGVAVGGWGAGRGAGATSAPGAAVGGWARQTRLPQGY